MLFTLGVAVHEYIIANNSVKIGYSLVKVYLFHAIYSFLLCAVFQILSDVRKWQEQLGFLYLGALVFKLVFFSVLFSSFLFGQETFTFPERVSMLVPVFIFLLPEVYFIYKILMKIDAIKN